MGYPTVVISMAEIEAIEEAAQQAYNLGDADGRLPTEHYLILMRLCDTWWSKYEPDEHPWEGTD